MPCTVDSGEQCSFSVGLEGSNSRKFHIKGTVVEKACDAKYEATACQNRKEDDDRSCLPSSEFDSSSSRYGSSRKCTALKPRRPTL